MNKTPMGRMGRPPREIWANEGGKGRAKGLRDGGYMGIWRGYGGLAFDIG
jgi:hypothetical protein